MAKFISDNMIPILVSIAVGAFAFLFERAISNKIRIDNLEKRLELIVNHITELNKILAKRR